MQAWFARCNGDTAHNQPGSKLYVAGEPPNYPDRKFNYRDDALRGGFARLGMPAAGDLRQSDWRQRLREAYGVVPDHKVKYLEDFASIRAGDVVLIPADVGRYSVHLGVAQAAPGTSAPAGIRPLAYYYHFDIGRGDWFENAHRVAVKWHLVNERWDIVNLPEIGGVWLRAFGRVEQAKSKSFHFARTAGLLD